MYIPSQRKLPVDRRRSLSKVTSFLKEHVMQALRSMARKLVRDERGLETVEYAIIAALITGAAILAITSLGTEVAAKFNTLVTALQ